MKLCLRSHVAKEEKNLRGPLLMGDECFDNVSLEPDRAEVEAAGCKRTKALAGEAVKPNRKRPVTSTENRKTQAD
jgi:hypothetical protein